MKNDTSTLGRRYTVYRKYTFIKDNVLCVESHKKICARNQEGIAVILSDDITSVQKFELTESTPEEIRKIRKNHEVLFVMRSQGKLWYTIIPPSISLLSTTFLGEHVCAYEKKVCKYLNFTSPEFGGCYRLGHIRHLEDMPELVESYETYGCNSDSWVVAKCTRCEY